MSRIATRLSAALVFAVSAAFAMLSMTDMGWAADTYPSKPVRLIIPYPPGGGLDTVGRPIAERLAARLGQPVVVENRPGGGTVIATEVVAKADNDGYTLLLMNNSFATQPNLQKVPYDPVKSFVSVARLVILPQLLVVHPNVAAKNVAELLGLAKKKPGSLILATSGFGGDCHVKTEQFRIMTGIDVKIVHFKGAGPAMIDLIGGHSDAAFISLTTMRPQIESGKARALANGAAKRSSIIPNVPTVNESVPGFEFSTWIGIVAPAGTPGAIVNRLENEFRGILAEEDIKSILAKIGAEPSYQSSAEFGSFFAQEIAEYGRIIKQADIKIQY